MLIFNKELWLSEIRLVPYFTLANQVRLVSLHFTYQLEFDIQQRLRRGSVIMLSSKNWKRRQVYGEVESRLYGVEGNRQWLAIYQRSFSKIAVNDFSFPATLSVIPRDRTKLMGYPINSFGIKGWPHVWPSVIS